MEELKLTQFSPGAGCGCKISPKDLEEILKSNIKGIYNENLLVGYDTKDDAAVFEIGNGQAIISTTDFFTPIVDNPFDFGRIAATNAISDIFAMGGKPLMAIAILGWPLEKLPASVAQQVVDGARTVCNNANIPLAGGHSIDISDPIFGLAVTGIVPVSNIKKNCNASDKCRLFLTKPIGIGILTTAEKRGLLKAEHNNLVIQLMTTLNSVGEELGNNIHIKAMTDVTGFGLLGHLLELCEGSNINAEIEYKKIPLIEGIDEYITHKTFPGGTYRNWKSYGHKSQLADESYKFVVCDPQTSGGLLVAVEEDGLNDFKNSCKKFNIEPIEIGFTKARINSTDAFVKVL